MLRILSLCQKKGVEMRVLHRYSTDDVEVAQRAKHWRDVVHASVVEMDLMPTGQDDFFSHITFCPLTDLVAHAAQGSPQRVTRNRLEIARGEKNAFYLLSQPRLAWWIRHGGQDALVQPGEPVLVDSRIPYELSFGAGLGDQSIELPIAWVEQWLADPASVIGRPIDVTTGWGRALSAVKEAMAPSSLQALAFPDQLLEDQLGSLLSLACGAQWPQHTPDRGPVDRFVDAMQARLSEPGLVAQTIADDCAVSVRSLHRCFAAQSRTFAGMLMEIRLARAHHMLSDPRFRQLTVAEIGRRCGFADGSHFARQWRRREGTAPAAYRSRQQP
jgi:AraC family transcriptional activator of tynA and feaB